MEKINSTTPSWRRSPYKILFRETTDQFMSLLLFSTSYCKKNLSFNGIFLMYWFSDLKRLAWNFKYLLKAYSWLRNIWITISLKKTWTDMLWNRINENLSSGTPAKFLNEQKKELYTLLLSYTVSCYFIMNYQPVSKNISTSIASYTLIIVRWLIAHTIQLNYMSEDYFNLISLVENVL